ncbi:MAG: type II secretion system F family protein [Candidatus Omnitrophica bacterium]|nr:type II secretion system F family protein [Candidatus Omnitrophota bacterium]
MAKYFFVARDQTGKRREGMLEADSNSTVLNILRRQQLLPVEVRLVSEKGTLVGITGEKKRVYRGKVSLPELALFSRQLSTMLEAGIPVLDAITDLASQTTNRFFSTVLNDIASDIREGKSFSQALSKHPKVFNSLYVALVVSGEESGNLVEVLKDLSSELEDQLTLLRKVRQAVSYPAVILLFFISVVAFVFLYLVPKFQEIFQSFGAQLPLFTRIILQISRFSLKFFPFLLIGLILLGIFLSWYRKTQAGSRKIDSLKLRIPVLGELFLKVSLARFSRSLATLLQGGVSIISALDIVGKTTGNTILEQYIEKIKQGVIKGELLGDEMKKYRIFPAMMVRMVTVGEETGRTDDMLTRVSKFFRDEVDLTLNILSSILEPVLIIGLGVIVGTVVLAIYLPIFKLAATVR